MYWESKRRIQQKKYYMTLSINYLTNQGKRRRISLKHIYHNIPHWLGLIRLVSSIHSNGLSALYIQQDIHRDCSDPIVLCIIVCACACLLLLLFKWVVLILNWKEEEDDEEQERSYVQSLPAMPCTRVDTRKEKNL